MEIIARALQVLSLAREYQKNFNRDYRLQKKGLYEQSEEMFKPLIVAQEKQTQALAELTSEALQKVEPKLNLKSIEPKANLPVELKTIQLGDNNLPKTWRIEQNSDGVITLNNKQLLQDDTGNTGSVGTIKVLNSNTSYPFTEGLKQLLGGEDVNRINDFDDINNYINIASEVSSSKGKTKRYNEALQRREELRHSVSTIIISENPKELWERLNVLMAASKEGHNNNLDEKTAILDKLLQLKEIKMKDYKTMV